MDAVIYSTRDEIMFILQLTNAGNEKALRNLRALLPYRSWEGWGMSVNPVSVELAIDRGLEMIEQKRLASPRRVSEDEDVRL